VAASTPNVLVYATSNRRHLLPEYMKDNLSYTHTEDGEMHPGEVVEEKISLSERFGLWVSFYPFSQDEYLAIVAQWLSALGASAAQIEAARPEALVWALERGSRSGRVAYSSRATTWGAGRRRDGRADPCRRPSAAPGRRGASGGRGGCRHPDPARWALAHLASAGQGVCGLLGVSGRQAGAGRERGAGAARELHEELGVTLDPPPSPAGASSWWTTRTPWCGCIGAR
jgi:hypothetical protein